MRRLIWLGFLSVGICLLASSASAQQDFSRKLTLGLQGGIWKSGLTEHSDIYTVGTQGGLLFKYNFKEKMALGFSVVYATASEADLSGREGGGAGFTFSGADDANRFSHTWLDLSLIYSFKPWERLNPYVFGGTGIAFWSVKDKGGAYVEVLDWSQKPFNLKDQELTFFGGGGIEYRFRERLGINLGARIRILSRILSSFEDSKVAVGGAPGELDLPKAAAEIFVGVNYYFGKLKDSDKDGVPDRVDFCADTPVRAAVDERGCPLDSDGDGIYDGLDRCPDTPAGAMVDVNGCSPQP